MSLHIDFIYASEQRSASLVSLKFVVRLLGMLIPVAALLFGSIAYFQTRQVKIQLKAVEAHWKTIEPVYLEATQLETDLASIRAIKKEMDGWRNLRLEWAKPLAAVRETVPETVQFTSLRFEENMKIEGTVPVYHGELIIQGRARGTAPRIDVEQLQSNLLEHAHLVDIIHDVVIPPGSFQADPDRDAEREHRIFSLRIPLIPRRFQ